jgi:predicted CxxxxCH...CXXCH cytochrome family protein
LKINLESKSCTAIYCDGNSANKSFSVSPEPTETITARGLKGTGTRKHGFGERNELLGFNCFVTENRKADGLHFQVSHRCQGSVITVSRK